MSGFQAIEQYTHSEEHRDGVTDVVSKVPRSSLSFIRKYTNKVDSLDLSGSFSAWYAPSTIFYNGDGSVYDGGKKI